MDYVAPAFTVLAQSTISEGDEPFPACLKHLRRLYPEVYGPLVFPTEASFGWAPACREFNLGEDGVRLDGDSISKNRFIELGAYAGRFKNLSPITSGTNNPIPNLTTAYLDTPSVGPMPEPLEYDHSQTKTGGFHHTRLTIPPYFPFVKILGLPARLHPTSGGGTSVSDQWGDTSVS